MFNQIKFNVVFKEGGEVKIVPVIAINFGELGVESVRVAGMEDGAVIPIDWDKQFLQSFSGKFDANGVGIYSGDIIKTKRKKIKQWENDTEHGEDDVFFSVDFIDGAYNALSVKEGICVYLNESLASVCEKVGTIYQNHDLIDVPIDPSQIPEGNL